MCSVCETYCRCLPPEEYVLFFDRLALVRKCKQLTGAELTTRTNVLLVRQSLLTPGNGVVFTYESKKKTKRSQHQGENPKHVRLGKRASSGCRRHPSLNLLAQQIVTFSCFRRAASLRIQRPPTPTAAAGSSSTPLPR